MTRIRTHLVTRALLAALLLLVLTGCYSLDTDMTLDEDGKMSGTVTIAMSKEYAEYAYPGADEDTFFDGNSTQSDFAELGFDADDVSSEPYSDENWVGRTLTITDHPILDKPIKTDTAEFAVERDGENYTVTGLIDPAADGNFAMMSKDSKVTLSLTFPGKVTDSNGDVDGKTVTWTATDGDPLEFTATGSAEHSAITGSLDSGWVIGGLGVLAVLIVLGAALAEQSRRKRDVLRQHLSKGKRPDEPSHEKETAR